MDTVFTGAFSDPDAGATPWEETERVLQEAELSWLTTVRADGRPHVTPLVGVWLGTTFFFATGGDEQKAHDLAVHDAVAVTTGTNTWARGLDVVVEGRARPVREHAELERVAAAYAEKYAGAWPFRRVGDQLTADEADTHLADLWAVRARKVLAFAKDPHAQTTYLV